MNPTNNTLKQKPQRAPDRRPIKTKKAIRSALLRLMQQKDVSQITVKELTDEADISRKTFYTHYANFREVLNEIESEFTLETNKILINSNSNNNGNGLHDFFLGINKLFENDNGYYFALANSGYKYKLFSHIKLMLRDSLKKSTFLNSNVDSDHLELAAEFSSAGVMYMYLAWFSGDYSITSNELAEEATQLIKRGFYGYSSSVQESQR